MCASTLNKKELFRLHMREVEDDYAVLIGDCEYYESQIESLQDENAKLRGLVEENKKLRVDWESERDYANQMEASAKRCRSMR